VCVGKSKKRKRKGKGKKGKGGAVIMRVGTLLIGRIIKFQFPNLHWVLLCEANACSSSSMGGRGASHT
jgi:hypothetical protein